LLEKTSTADILSSNELHSAGKVAKKVTAENDDDDSHNKVECTDTNSSTAQSKKTRCAVSTGNAFERQKYGLSDVKGNKTSSAHLAADAFEKQRADLFGAKHANFPSADNLSTTQDGEKSPAERMAIACVIIVTLLCNLVRRAKAAFSSTNSCSSAPDWKTGSVGKTSCADEKQDAGVAELEEPAFISAASYPSTLRRKTSHIEFLANADTKELSSGSVETGKPLLSSQEALSGEESTFDSTTFNKNETMALIDKAIKRFDEELFDADAQMETLSSGNSANFLKVL